ncbi:MAG TPA: hypothetical protein VET85_13390 [Stellaceae bacterium]|nr:hypothetical protein [Stellaceae bacterium]
MRQVLCSLIGVFAALAFHPATAADLPPAEMPTLKVGDAIEYSPRFVNLDCKRWEVTNLNKDGYLTIQCQDKIAYVSSTGNLSKIVSQDGEKLVEFKPYLPSISFPLTLGKKWEGKYSGYTADNGLRWLGDNSCEVAAVEQVKVPAGDFEAYRIDCLDKVDVLGHIYPIHTNAWYAPSIGATVKFVNKENPPYSYDVTYYKAK